MPWADLGLPWVLQRYYHQLRSIVSELGYNVLLHRPICQTVSTKGNSKYFTLEWLGHPVMWRLDYCRYSSFFNWFWRKKNPPVLNCYSNCSVYKPHRDYVTHSLDVINICFRRKVCAFVNRQLVFCCVIKFVPLYTELFQVRT